MHSLHHVESAAAAVHKSKEKYYQLCVEVDKLKKAGGSPKEVEKVRSISTEINRNF